MDPPEEHQDNLDLAVSDDFPTFPSQLLGLRNPKYQQDTINILKQSSFLISPYICIVIEVLLPNFGCHFTHWYTPKKPVVQFDVIYHTTPTKHLKRHLKWISENVLKMQFRSYCSAENLNSNTESDPRFRFRWSRHLHSGLWIFPS